MTQITQEERDTLTYFYTCGKLTLKEVFDMATEFKINQKDFHWITGLSYNGIKKSRGW